MNGGSLDIVPSVVVLRSTPVTFKSAAFATLRAMEAFTLIPLHGRTYYIVQYMYCTVG